MNTKTAFKLMIALLWFTPVAVASTNDGQDQQNPPENHSQDTGNEEASATSGRVVAAPVPKDADKLARQLSNPISSLISVPFQYNYARKFNDDGYRNLLNIQPVIPFSLSENWNLISRSILPVIQQQDVQPNRKQFGLGDVTQSVWLSPKDPTASGWIWGLGMAGLLPTGTDGIGADTWAFGPTAVVLKQTGPWTYGFLWNQLWDTGGRADISSMFLQPFLAKGLGGGRTLSVNAESTYNWKTRDWTIPINIAYSKVSKWGDQMVSNQFGAGWYVASPDGGAEWQVRYTLTLLFPK